MLLPGLCSVTFRNKKPEEIVLLAKRAGLSAIEWGGDIHVPHGDLKKAREVGRLCGGQGILTTSYGSYYRLGERSIPFREVLETAWELGAGQIRIWAGTKASGVTNETQWQALAEEASETAALARDAGIQVCTEYHGGTLTDSPESALRLLTACPLLRTYWQPLFDRTEQQERAILEGLSGRLAHIHVFHWAKLSRLPLSEGKNRWRGYLEFVKRLPDTRCAYLEFVREDSVEQFLADAAVLKELL